MDGLIDGHYGGVDRQMIVTAQHDRFESCGLGCLASHTHHTSPIILSAQMDRIGQGRRWQEKKEREDKGKNKTGSGPLAYKLLRVMYCIELKSDLYFHR